MSSNFRVNVNEIVKMIPELRVMTYGQIAGLAGNAGASRIVGGIAHYGDPSLPWHRVVNRNGRLATGYPGGIRMHAEVMQAEGFFVSQKSGEFYIDLVNYLWSPV